MKKLLGLRSLASVAVAAAAVGSIVGGFSASAGAAAPPWETTGSAYGSVGGLTLYNSAGQPVTSGKLSDTPVAAYVEGTSTVRSGDTKATLYAYTPVDGVAPGTWSGEPLSASTAFPNASAPSPLNSATLPLVTGSSGDESLSEYIGDYPNKDTSTSDGYAGIYQLRLKTTANGEPGNTTYDSADIEVSGTSWSLVYSVNPVYNILSAPNLTATPLTPYSGTFTVVNTGASNEVAAAKVKWTATGVPVGFKFSKGVLSDTSGKKMVADEYTVDVTAVQKYTVENTVTTTNSRGQTKTKIVKTKETGTATFAATLDVS